MLSTICFSKNKEQAKKHTNKQTNKRKIKIPRTSFAVTNVGLFENEYQGTWARVKTEAAISRCSSKLLFLKI